MGEAIPSVGLWLILSELREVTPVRKEECSRAGPPSHGTACAGGTGALGPPWSAGAHPQARRHSCSWGGGQARDPATGGGSASGGPTREFPADQREGARPCWVVGVSREEGASRAGASHVMGGRDSGESSRSVPEAEDGGLAPRESHQRGPTSQNQGSGPSGVSRPGVGPGCVPTSCVTPGSALPAPPRFVWFTRKGTEVGPSP